MRVSTSLLAHARTVGASLLGAVLLAGCGPWSDAAPTAHGPASEGTASAVSPAPPAAGPRPAPGAPLVRYRLGVARSADVVVVIESTGPVDPAGPALDLAVERAVSTGTADRLLSDADWARIIPGPHPVPTSQRPRPLVDCVSLAPWAGAEHFRGVTYTDRGRPETGLNQFVLRYPDRRQAALQVLRIRNQFDDCPGRGPQGGVRVRLHEAWSRDDGSSRRFDETFVGERLLPPRTGVAAG